MRHILTALLILITAPAWAEFSHDDGGARFLLQEQSSAQDFRPLPLHRAAQIVAERYRGRLIAARLSPSTPHEQDLGVDLAYELRLLTPDRNLLMIRLDARTGRFLEVAGIGQIEALKK